MGADAVSSTGETRRVAGRGAVQSYIFRRACGILVHVTFDAVPDVMAGHAGSLDATERFLPTNATCAGRSRERRRHDPRPRQEVRHEP
ncbi:MAG: hypothetical protein ACU0DK_15460 [Pseudooceanicola sp.]